MGKDVIFDYSKAAAFIHEEEIAGIKAGVQAARETLVEKTGAGNDFLGWIDLPVDYDKEEFGRIKKAAEKIQKDSDVLLVIGIGGSYLGARAAIEFLSHSFYNNLPKEKRKTPEIYFVGNSISSKYILDLMDLVDGKDFSINIISKSGTTTEPAIAFRVFKEMLIEKYGKEEANKRIYATTDRARGALKNLANEEGYESFVVPDDVGVLRHLDSECGVDRGHGRQSMNPGADAADAFHKGPCITGVASLQNDFKPAPHRAG